jgi:hypothetical protein
MNVDKRNKFSEKHGSDATPDRFIEEEILKQGKNKKLPCAVAFEISRTLKVSPDAVGMTADLMNFKLTKCQLGLFGYQPQKKIVKHPDRVTEDLKNAIADQLVQGRLSCQRAWDIASGLKIGKMKVSGACEAMDIKITGCQLGAF